MGAAAVSLLCVATALTLASPASAARPARIIRTVRVIEQNINYGQNSRTLPNLESQLRSKKPDVAMVIEICRAEVQQFQKAFPGWHTHYTPLRTTQKGCARASGGVANPYSKGEMLASPHPITSVARYNLQSKRDGTRKFHLTCGNVQLGGSTPGVLRACATHLRNGQATWKKNERAYQARQIRTILARQIKAGRPVVLSGDFNAEPTEAALNPIYGLNDKGHYTTSGGAFDESQQGHPADWPKGTTATCRTGHCRAGQYTVREAGKKVDPHGRFDYFFWSRSFSTDLTGTRLPYNGSDHYPILSTAKLSLGTS